MYTTFYKLSAKPFQLSPDPNFFFASSGHKRAMAYLNYGLSLAEGFIVITGEVGAGKTLLVRKLFSSFGTENIVSAHLVSTQLDAEDTLRTVAAGFGLEQEGRDKSSIIKSLENFLVHCKQQRKRVLLVVDEAQNLTSKAVEELRMLSNFQMGNQSLLQSFLIGQPELRNTLQSEEMLQLKQRVIASYHLGPIEAAETQNYIEHRLTLAGWKGDPEFTPEAYQLIFEFTGGIPRKINTLCDRLMVFGMLEERHRIDRDMVEEVIKDLEQEVTHAALPAQPLRSSTAPAAELSGTQEGIARLEAKMDSIEKSLTQLLAVLVRKLHPAVEGNTEK
jgi:putative secretion ATPase (PEP-CTERM system associated)